MALTKVTGSVIKDSVSLSGNVSVGGTLTYQDVTNVDALGIGTFRTGIKVLAGQVDIGSNIKLGNAGIITATELDISGDIDVDGHTNLDNVSIAGVTTTTETIRIQGNNKYLQVGASNQIGVVHTGGEAFIANSTGHLTHRCDVHKWENNAGSSEYLRITSGGSVNLGTGELTQTARKLNVYGGATRVTQTSGGNTVEVFGHTTSGQSYGLLVNAGSTSGDYCANFRNSSGTTLFRIRGDGKIGINENTPTAELEVQPVGTACTSTIFIHAPQHNTNVASETILKFGYGHSGSPDGVGHIKMTEQSGNSFDADFIFGLPTNNGSGGSVTNEKLRISSAGNLTQTGSGNIVHYINTGNNSGDNSTIAFGDTADADVGHINYDHGTNAFQIRTNGASNSVVITNEGYMQTLSNPSFRAGLSGNTTFNQNTNIIFNDTGSTWHYNRGNHYNTSNGRFTAPVSGVYQFNACIIWYGAQNNTFLGDAFHFYVNNGNACYSGRRAWYNTGTTGNSLYYTDHMSVNLYLNATDYINIRQSSPVVTVHGNTYYTWFAGSFLG